MQFVGISLSFCVRDVLEGKIKLDNVAFLVPNFPWPNPRGIPPWGMPPYYRDTYWKKFPNDAINAVLSAVEIRGRPSHIDSVNISSGVWIPEAEFDWDVYREAACRLTTDDVIGVIAGDKYASMRSLMRGQRFFEICASEVVIGDRIMAPTETGGRQYDVDELQTVTAVMRVNDEIEITAGGRDMVAPKDTIVQVYGIPDRRLLI